MIVLTQLTDRTLYTMPPGGCEGAHSPQKIDLSTYRRPSLPLHASPDRPFGGASARSIYAFATMASVDRALSSHSTPQTVSTPKCNHERRPIAWIYETSKLLAINVMARRVSARLQKRGKGREAARDSPSIRRYMLLRLGYTCKCAVALSGIQCYIMEKLRGN